MAFNGGCMLLHKKLKASGKIAHNDMTFNPNRHLFCWNASHRPLFGFSKSTTFIVSKCSSSPLNTVQLESRLYS